MDINSLTIGEAKQIASMFSITTGNTQPSFIEPWEIGKNYLIRTVTMIDIGRLVAVTPTELVLTDAAWVADTGRFSECLKTGNYSEVEPFPDGRVIVGRGSVIDAVQISTINRSLK